MSIKEKILNWFVRSSENPEKTSLTLRGFLLTHIAMIIFIAQSFNWKVSHEWLTMVVQTACAVFGILMTILGLIRKLVFAIKDARKAILAPMTPLEPVLPVEAPPDIAVKGPEETEPAKTF